MLRSTPQPVELGDSRVYVFESRHAPGFEMDMGVWDFDKICIVRRGRGAVVSETDEASIGPDDILYLPVGMAHRFRDDPGEPMTLLMVCFIPDVLASIPGVDRAVADFSETFPVMRPYARTQTHRGAAIAANLKRMVFEQTTARPGGHAVVWGLLAQLIVMLTRSFAETTDRSRLSQREQAFARTLDFLEERYTEQLQIQDLATMAGLSYRRYTTLFKELKGETVNAYVTAKRLEFAKLRLSETGNIALSALEAGFGDVSHFYRVFKAREGMTPRQFIGLNVIRSV